MSTELYIPPQKPKPKPYNPANGQFLKGNVPHNKGKKWDDYMPKRSQRRAAKGWKNIEIHRPTSRPDTAGRCRKAVVAITDDGKFHVFKDAPLAAEWLKRYTGESCNRENIGRCCRENASERECKHSWRPGQKKGSSTINTDHRYKGVRWYFENDYTWYSKVARNE